jgi:hypothetical protein
MTESQSLDEDWGYQPCPRIIPHSAICPFIAAGAEVIVGET